MTLCLHLLQSDRDRFTENSPLQLKLTTTLIMAINGHSKGHFTGLPQSQKAAQYSSKSNSITVNSIPLPAPSKDQLFIKVASASLCHSDLMLLEPNEAGIVLGDGSPVTIGHEATGTILSVPETCTDPTLKVGARIGFLCPERVCYECDGCQIHNAWCKDGKAVMSGFGRDGFFQEYVVSHWRNAIVLPEALDLYEAAPLFCAGVTSWQGITEAKIKPGEWMAIVGCGGLGHLGAVSCLVATPELTISRNPIRQSPWLQSHRHRSC